MAEPVGALHVAMSAGYAQMTSDLGKAHAAVRTFGNRTRVAMDSVRKSFENALGSLKSWGKYAAIGAITGAAYGMERLVKSSIDLGDELYKMSQKIGVPIERLSTLAYAAKLSDLELDALGKGLRFLSNAAVDTAKGTGEARKAFAALGVSVTDANGKLRPSDQLLLDLADKFALLEDGVMKTAIASDLFGARAGAEMIPLLNQGSAAIRRQQAEAARLGHVFTTLTGQQMEQFNDQMTTLKTGVMGLAISLGALLVPSLNRLVGGFIAARAAGDGFFKALSVAARGGPEEMARQGLKEVTDQIAKDLKEAQDDLSRIQNNWKQPAWSLSALFVRGTEKDAQAKVDRLTAQYQDMIEWTAALDKARADRAKAASDEETKATEEQIRKYTDLVASLYAVKDAKEDGAKAGKSETQKAADQAIESGRQAIDQMLRERDVREDASHVETLAFELESGHLRELHALRQTGTADQQAEAAAIEDKLQALARELDLRDVLAKIEADAAERAAAHAEAAHQIIADSLSEVEQLRGQLTELDRQYGELSKRLPGSLLVGDLGDDALVSPAQYSAARKRLEMMLEAAEAAERYEAEQRQLNAAVAAGTISHRDYDLAMARSAATMEDAAAVIVRQWELVDRVFEDWSMRATDALVRFAMTGKLTFSDFARSVIADLLRIQIQAQMTQLFEGMARGAAGTWLGTLLGGGETKATPPAPVHIIPGTEVAVKPTLSMSEVARVGQSELRSAAKLASYTPAEAEAAPAGGAQNIRIVNVLDPSVVSDWAASAEGERVIVAAVAKHATQLSPRFRT